MEEPDFISQTPDSSMTPEVMALSKKVHDAYLTLLCSFGFNAELGRRLYHEVSQNGIGDVQAEVLSLCALVALLRRGS